MSEPVDLDAIVRWFDDLERMGLPAKSVRALVAELEALRGENQRLRAALGGILAVWDQHCESQREGDWRTAMMGMFKIARDALGGEA